MVRSDDHLSLAMEEIAEAADLGRQTDRRVPWQQWKKANETQKLQVNQYLLETSARVDDAISELLSMMNWLDVELKNLDECRGKLQRKERVNSIRSTVEVINHPLVALLYIASDALRQAGMTLAPMGATKVLYERNDAKRKRDLSKQSQSKSVELRMIENFVDKSEVDWRKGITQRKYSKVNPFDEGNSNGKLPITLPPTLNGEQYTKRETAHILSEYSNTGIVWKSDVMKYLVEQNLVPVGIRTLQRLAKRYEEEGGDVSGAFYDSWEMEKGKSCDDSSDVDVKATDSRIETSPEDATNEESLTEPMGPEGSEKNTSQAIGDAINIQQKESACAAADAGNGEIASALSDPTASATLGKAPIPKMDSTNTPKKNKLTTQSASPDRKKLKVAKRREITMPKLPTRKKDKTPSRVRDFPLPPPINGHQYTKPEAVHLARSYPRDSMQRGSAVSAMIHRGYVPGCKRTLQRLVKLAEDGLPVPDTRWTSSNGGQPPILDNEDIDAIVARIMEKNIKVNGKADVVEMLVHAAKAKMIQKGEDPSTSKAGFSNGAVQNYMTIFKSKLPAEYWA
jgi:hypothetical protein